MSKKPDPIPTKDSTLVEGASRNTVRPVVFYLSALFAVALLLLLVSFLMQQRNQDALLDPKDPAPNSIERVLPHGDLLNRIPGVPVFDDTALPGPINDRLDAPLS